MSVLTVLSVLFVLRQKQAGWTAAGGCAPGTVLLEYNQNTPMEDRMRQFVIAILMMLIGSSASADTTNRALQVSPVPGLFVGGVGLLCKVDDPAVDMTQYVLFTKDRETFGWARFDKDDDIYYMNFEVSKSPDHYRVANDTVKIEVNRKTLRLTMDSMGSESGHVCEAMSITNLHEAAKVELRKLLKGNRI